MRAKLKFGSPHGIQLLPTVLGYGCQQSFEFATPQDEAPVPIPVLFMLSSATASANAVIQYRTDSATNLGA